MARPLTQDAVRLINDYHQGGYSNGGDRTRSERPPQHG